MRRGLLVFALVLVLLLAGCSALDFGEDTISEPESNRPDPASDRLGWEDGYWWNDSVAVDGSDGLTQAEVEVVKARMMARLEHLRGYEFTREVSVRVISRETYRDQRGGGGSGEAPPWREQFWEALFVVGEDTGVEAAFDRLYGSTVLGYYTSDKIVLVSDDPNDLRVSRATLAHELEHALQDQHLGLGYRTDTRDGRLAAQAVIEGDANYVEARYEDACKSGEWSCVTVAGQSGGGSRSADYNVGLSVATFVPYGEGPVFVSELHDRGGWDAVDGAFEDHPASTEQVIHSAKYPDETPVAVSIPDRATGGWERLETDEGEDRAETVGEANVYTMLWYAEVISREHLTSRNGSVSRYTYDHPLSTGWAGDRLVFYGNGDQQAYVWQSTWDSEADATEFRQAYEDVLAANDATARGNGVYAIESGAFEDAFRVVQRGDTVVVVNAPTVDALDAVHRVSSGSNTSVGQELRSAGLATT
ncbi:Hvo_1808 family surface protein [Haloarchaeobius sp. TZWSO28]|uniref:Hvo_1808 family surface protein n=1 Tax=Haloarchaeobius sp. TZWSO28 TaxID=3446119 RepID=UPI003EB89024